MSTQEQIDANRRNSQSSTGPSTPEGKAASRLNSLQHGLRAATLILPYERREEVTPPLLYFHSYRRVRDGNIDLGAVLSSNDPRRGTEYALGLFKIDLLRAMMSSANLFDTVETPEFASMIDKLNWTAGKYAGGTIAKLRPDADGSVEIRISPTGGGPPFSIDGLSSGQKEIVATLFLIWRYTADSPGIVLIDEPELHLNAEWHRRIIRDLAGLVPDNQYIVATHSEDVFASVDEDHRILLASEGAVVTA
jgi:hypothetical protein